MKTLVYRHNPLIHISAPEIKEADFAGNINYVIETNGEPFNLHFHKEDWTLVEEEYIENRNDGTYTFINTEEEPKHTEVWLEGRTIFEQEGEPTGGIKENLEEIPSNVDLEKALNGLDNAYFDLDGIAVKGATYYLTVNDLKDIARDFYELGLNARKEK